MEFFTNQGARIGSKRDLEEVIQSVTNIPLTALRGESLSNFGIRERLGWMHGRETTLAEDYAYCLFGILDVSLPIIYGESRRAAMDRLLERARILLTQHMRDKSLAWDIRAQRLLPESGFSEAAPALVECQGSLVAVWRGRAEAFWVMPFVNINSLYWTTLRKSNDGTHLTAEPPKPIQGNVESPERPGLATLANKLVAVWKGVNHDTLYFSTLDHGSQQWENPTAVHPQAVSSAGPALACWEWNGSARVCAVWKGAGSDLNIYLSWYDGKRWSWPKPLQFAQTDVTPGITCRNGELFLAWKASGTDKLFWIRLDSDGNALLVEPHEVCWDGRSFSGPALAELDGIIYAAWKAVGNPADLRLAAWSVDAERFAPAQHVHNSITTRAPTLAVFGTTLVIAWRGEEGEKTMWYSLGRK